LRPLDLSLTVTDVPVARRFLETFFGLQGSRNPYTGEAIPDAGNAGFCVLFDDNGLGAHVDEGP
jgi:hypothetical protein